MLHKGILGENKGVLCVITEDHTQTHNLLCLALLQYTVGNHDKRLEGQQVSSCTVGQQDQSLLCNCKGNRLGAKMYELSFLHFTPSLTLFKSQKDGKDCYFGQSPSLFG